MGLLRLTNKVFPIPLLIFLIACDNNETHVANFNISEIEGDYTAQVKMDFSGPRPAVSVFGGSLTVSLNGADDFILSIDFPDDYVTTDLNGTAVEQIVNSSNKLLGGISFVVEETDEFMANPDQIDVETRNGEIKKAYATFLETAGDNLIMQLFLKEKDESPIEFEFKAVKE